MADTKTNTFNMRVQLKYDTLSNWSEYNPTLLAGEVALVTLADIGNAAGKTPTDPDNGTHPVLMKVGPGAFNSLPWMSALAADVHAWAKQANLPVKRSDDDGTEGNVISGISWDSTKNELVYTTATVATSQSLEQLTNKVTTIENNYTTDTELATAVETINKAIALKADKSYVDAELEKKANQSDFGALKSKVEGPDGALAKANENANAIANVINGTTPVAKATNSLQLGGTDADSYALKTDAQGYANAVLGSDADTFESYTVHGALKAVNKVESRLNAFLEGTGDNTEDVIDTLVEIQKFMTGDTGEFVALSKKVTDIENGDTAVIAKNLNEAGKEVVKGIKVDNATNADYANDLTNNAKTVVKGVKVDNAVHADNATQLNGKESSAYLLKTDAPGYADILTKTEASTTYQPAGNYATAEQGGKADSAVQPGDLATVAKSGLISDLTQTANTYIVINCGSSSSVI